MMWGWDEMELYDCYAVTGTSAEVNGAFTGYILCTPDELEYLIDCMSGDTPVKRDNEYVSTVWTAASGLDSLLNKDSSDQAKTADNSWGLDDRPVRTEYMGFMTRVQRHRFIPTDTGRMAGWLFPMISLFRQANMSLCWADMISGAAETWMYILRRRRRERTALRTGGQS